MNMRTFGGTAVACLVAVTLVAGCGKKGAPKPPSETQKTEQPAN